MGKLLRRLEDPSRSGAYRVERADEVLDATRASSLDVARVRFGPRQALLASFAQALAFPDWFGRNWDALEDCLSDLSWRPGTGTVLLLEQAQPEADFDTLLEVLRAAASFHRAHGRPFFAVFVDPGGALPLPALFRPS